MRRLLELVAMRGVPCHPRNVRAADADIGKFAVAQARQFTQALIVALPLLDEADECGKHSVLLSLRSPAESPANDFVGKIGILGYLKSGIVALQLGEKRIAYYTDY